MQFVEPSYPYPALSFLALGAWAELFSITYLTVLIFGGQALSSSFRRRRRKEEDRACPPKISTVR